MLVLVVALYLNSGWQVEFAEYESAASRIMRRYGGTIERRIGFTPADESHPDEVHIVTFPDHAAFERYRIDPELAALAEFRLRAIRLTTVWSGTDQPIYE